MCEDFLDEILSQGGEELLSGGARAVLPTPEPHEGDCETGGRIYRPTVMSAAPGDPVGSATAGGARAGPT